MNKELFYKEVTGRMNENSDLEEANAIDYRKMRKLEGHRLMRSNKIALNLKKIKILCKEERAK